MDSNPSSSNINPARSFEAAKKLFEIGQRHGWWPASLGSWEEIDPIGRDEFIALTEEVIKTFMHDSGAYQKPMPPEPH